MYVHISYMFFNFQYEHEPQNQYLLKAEIFYFLWYLRRSKYPRVKISVIGFHHHKLEIQLNWNESLWMEAGIPIKLWKKNWRLLRRQKVFGVFWREKLITGILHIRNCSYVSIEVFGRPLSFPLVYICMSFEAVQRLLSFFVLLLYLKETIHDGNQHQNQRKRQVLTLIHTGKNTNKIISDPQFHRCRFLRKLTQRKFNNTMA